MDDPFKHHCIELEACLGSKEAGHLAAFIVLGLGELALQLHERGLIDLPRFEEMLDAGPLRRALSPTWTHAFEVLSAHLHQDQSDAIG